MEKQNIKNWEDYIDMPELEESDLSPRIRIIAPSNSGICQHCYYMEFIPLTTK